MSRPHTPTFAAVAYPSAVLQPRATLFDIGVLPVDLLRLGAPPVEAEATAAAAAAATVAAAAAASASSAASSAAAAAAGPLSSHPIRSLTYGPRPSVSSPPPRRPLPQARLDALHAACRADRSAGGRSGLSLASWTKQAAAHFGASSAQAQTYWATFLATHRSSYTACAAAPGAAAAAGSGRACALLAPPLLHTEVDLQEFFLFLFAQRYARFKAVYATSHSIAPSASAGGAACMGAETQKAFLVQHLFALLTLCKDDGCPTPESEAAAAAAAASALTSSSSAAASSTTAAASSILLSAREVDRLSILVQGVPHPLETREATALSSLTPFFTPAAAASALPGQGAELTVSLATLSTWLGMQLNRPALSLSLSLSMSSEDASSALLIPDSNSPRLGPGKPCIWLPLLPHVELRSLRDKNAFLRRARPGEMQPDVSIAASSCGASAASVCSTDHASLERVVAVGGLLHVHHCSGLSLYANVVHRFASLSHLSHCSLHLGVVTHLTRIDHCSHCVLYLVAPEGLGGGRGVGYNVQISHCDNVKIFLWTQGRVQLLHARHTKQAGRIGAAGSTAAAAVGIGGFSLADLTGAETVAVSDAFEGAESDAANNSGIVLAPYNTCYPELENDLRSVGANASARNSWAAFAVVEPIELPRASAGNASAGASANTQSSVPSKPASGVAAGGRKSKTAQALAGGGSGSNNNSQTNLLLGSSAGAGVAPIFQTFPALLLQPSSSTTPAGSAAGSAASSPALGPAASPTGPAAAAGSAAAAVSSVSTDVVSLLSPKEFFPCVQASAPSSVSSGGAAPCGSGAAVTTRNPFELPLEFAEALAQRHEQALRNRGLIAGAKLGLAQTHSLHAMIQVEFQLWLQMHRPCGFLTNLQRADQERAQALLKLQRAAASSSSSSDVQSSAATSLLQQQLAYARKNRL